MAHWHRSANHIRRLYSKLFPFPCLLCGLPCPHSAVCDACRGDLPRIKHACQRCALPLNSAQICGQCQQSPPIQQRTLSLYLYEGTVRRCITAFKYQQRFYLAEFFAQAFIQQLPLAPLPDCIVPIPLHRRRLWQRGYNQSLLVAQAIARSLNIPCCPEYLKRIRPTAPQENLNAQQRRQNLRHAFICPVDKVPQHIALFDDVITSGATCEEACRLLQKHGANQLDVWTLARTVHHA